MKQKRFFAALLAGAVAISLSACRSGGGEDGSQGDGGSAGVAVQVQSVTADTISAGSSVSGQVVNDSEKGSVFVSANARCTAVYVEEGDDIQAGEPICALDMTETLSAIETATTSYNDTQRSYQDQEALFDAQIALAEKNITDARKSYQDQEALFDSQIALAEKSISDAKKSYQEQDALLNSQIALAEKAVSDARKSYQEQEEFFNSQIALAEKNVRDLEALMAIGGAAQIEIDQAELSLQSLQTSKSSTMTQLETGIQNAETNLQSAQTARSSTMAQLETGVQSAETNLQTLQTPKSSAIAQLETGIQNAETSLQSVQASKTATLAQLGSGMRSAQNNIDQLRTVMKNVDDKGNVIAPVSGKILSLNAVENSYVGPTAPVAVIDGEAKLEIAVSVSEALVPRLAQGDEVDIQISALDLSAVGTIREIEKEASYQTKLYAVSIDLIDPPADLRAGLFVDVSFRTEVSSNTIVIPTEAILSSNEEQYVFVVEDGKARYVSVTTGIAGNGVTEITRGLSAGDQLVTVGQAYLTDGAAVRIVSGEG